MPPSALFYLLLSVPSLQRSDTVRAREVALIAESSTATPTFFGEVSGFAFDRAGRLYVTDFKEPRVTVLDASGKQVALIGRKGQGPGEFEAPTGPAFGKDGSLFVRNMRTVVRLSVDANSGLASRYDSAFAIPMNVNWRSKEPSIVDASGFVVLPAYQARRDGPATHYFLRFTPAGRFVDSLPVPLYHNTPTSVAAYMISANTGRMVRGLNVAPFAPAPVYASTVRGTVVSGSAEGYELVETARAGQTLRKLARSATAERIPAAERAESARALKRRIDSLPVPLDKVLGVPEAVRSQRLPEVYSVYIGVVSAPNGDVWVRRWARNPSVSVFDLFNANGRFARTVVIPRRCAPEPAPAVQGDRFACLVVDADSGEESILIASVGTPKS